MHFSKQDIEARRERLISVWDLLLQDDEAVLVYAGSVIQKPGGLDQHYPFLPHPAYYWLTARRREDEVILYNKNIGWIEFQKHFTSEQAIWENEKDDLLLSEHGCPLNELDSYVDSQKFTHVYELGQTTKNLKDKAFVLRTILDQTRRKKDEAEIKLIKLSAQIAQSGYKEIKRIVQPGVSEKDIQIVYESAIFKHGAHSVPYETIVGSGPNSAVLHALPTQKIIKENEFVLIDAGVDIFDYCVDITRIFPSSANMSSQHKDLYQLVLTVQNECIAFSKPGVQWRKVHIKAAMMFTEGLRDLGILKGSFTGLVEKEVISVFFPHGLGHLVGLRVRDTGQEENLEPKSYFGSRLRIDMQLEAGHLVTVEPGLYFIRSLLNNDEIQNRFKDEICWREIEKWKDIGGVRIEDNVLITETGNENLTSCVSKALKI